MNILHYKFLKGTESPKMDRLLDSKECIFPNIALEQWKRKMIIAEVVSLATKAMFGHHYFKFGGDTFHQVQRGSI